jgi:hypothetical protein
VEPDGGVPLTLAVDFVVSFVAVFFVDSFFAAPDFVCDADPNHVLTPPCLEHAPRWVLAVENVPSVHWALALAGAFAGF